eukprot:jgi/Orpsp1_1/1176902/evm.model.c7180000059442.1
MKFSKVIYLAISLFSINATLATRCGKEFGVSCKEGYCCSKYGYCGKSSDYCGDGCQLKYGVCNSTTTKKSTKKTTKKTTTVKKTTTKSSSATNISTNGKCGPKNGNTICPKNRCCSKYGYCGETDDYCGTGCQSEFGRCNKTSATTKKTTTKSTKKSKTKTTTKSSTATNISINGKCGPKNGNTICPKDRCCSKYGYCGTSDKYCGAGCQSEFGKCKDTTSTTKIVKTTTTKATSKTTTKDADKTPEVSTPKNAINAQMVVQGYEWGPAVPKVIVEFDDKVSGFTKDTFKVKTGNSERVILDVYNSDVDGKKEKSATKYLTFELKVNTIEMYGMTFGDANPFDYDMTTGRNSWSKSFELELDLAKSKTFKVGNFEYGNENAFKTYKKNLSENYVVPETASWKKDSFKLKDGKYTLQRASFTPEGAETDGVKNPLVIWLHGAGEGGVDIDIDLLGNEVTALAKEEIQKYFTTEKQKGAYVLAVQTPTMWMDKGDGTYNNDANGTRQKSCYDEVLFAAIQDYVKNNSDIDTNRIYLGGCSNGGYMTMNLMFEHGDFFTAFYPICEAYMNRNISDEMIEQVKDYNIWFLHSEDDTTVAPLSTSIPSYYRLLKAGAKNVHYTLTDKVRGTDDPNA